MNRRRVTSDYTPGIRAMTGINLHYRKIESLDSGGKEPRRLGSAVVIVYFLQLFCSCSQASE